MPFPDSTLHDLGWSGFFESQLDPATGSIPGRIASANHGRFLVWTVPDRTAASQTEFVEVDASVTGTLRK